MRTTRKIVMSVVGLLAISLFTCAGAQQDQTILDKDIRVVDFAELIYPAIARTAHLQGVVVVRAKLDDSGKVVDADVISGSEVFAPACLANVKRWRFRPNAKKAVVIVYNFRMPGGECKSASSLFMLQGPNLVTITGCDVSVQTAP